VLPRGFFAGSSLQVAAELLGCVLEHDTAAGRVAVQLSEVEAYEGMADPASHAYRGQTARNAVMFGPPGHTYVYFTYGMHFCVNLVCGPVGTPSAVLLRAGQVIEGAPLAAERRLARRRPAGRGLAGRAGAAAPAERELAERELAERELAERELAERERAGRERAGRELARGPARLCQALGIDRALDGADVCDPASSLRIRPGPLPADASPLPAVSRGPRVGVSSAADRPWRFWLTGDPTVSDYRPYVPRARPKAVSPSAGEGGTMGR